MLKNIKSILSWLALILVGYFSLTALVNTAGNTSSFYILTIQTIGINMILAVSLNLIVGFAGQLSLGHAGFMAIGAYTMAIITTKMPMLDLSLSFILGMLIAGLVALLVGVPTLRLKGDYLAIATLGVAEIIRVLIINGGDLTNGAAGITGVPTFVSWEMVYFAAVVVTLLATNLLRSPLGRQTLSVREDEIAAESVGVNTTKVKVIIFVLGAVFAALAGGLYSGSIGTVVPKDFAFMKSVQVLIIVVLGGLGSMTGTIIAAILLGLLDVVLRQVSDVQMIIYSLALILIMIFRPGGLLGTWEFNFDRFFNKSKGDK